MALLSVQYKQRCTDITNLHPRMIRVRKLIHNRKLRLQIIRNRICILCTPRHMAQRNFSAISCVAKSHAPNALQKVMTTVITVHEHSVSTKDR